MNICIFTDSISNSGGIERVTVNIANMWFQLGHKVTIVLLDTDTSSYFKLNNNIKIVSLKVPRYKKSYEIIVYMIRMGYKFRQYLKLNKVDVVCAIWTSRAISAQIASIGMKIPVVACEHIAYTQLREGLQFLRSLVYPYVAAIVSLTKGDAILYKKINKNTFVIPNEITDIEEKEYNGQDKTVLAVGRLVPQKGFDLLLNSWRIVHKHRPDWNLKIIGRELPEYKDFAQDLHKAIREECFHKSITIHNQTQSIMSEYDKASIFVLSSRFEGLPLVLLEAMSRALPVVSFNCPTGPKDVITNGENGILVSNGDVYQLAENIIKLIDNKELRKRLGDCANQSIAKHYHKDIISEKWMKLFQFIESYNYK